MRLPVVNVVVLPSPPPVLVGEAVDLQELFFAQTRDSSKVSGIGQSEGKEEKKKDKDRGKKLASPDEILPQKRPFNAN